MRLPSAVVEEGCECVIAEAKDIGRDYDFVCGNPPAYRISGYLLCAKCTSDAVENGHCYPQEVEPLHDTQETVAVKP